MSGTIQKISLNVLRFQNANAVVVRARTKAMAKAGLRPMRCVNLLNE